ncbi:hypothetical protein AYL99_02914 [Fonsecaea erecta]|uniref:C2H2-type domain-containing protein n=1 Tax=Fonsecaea erecta TaxID=1367422 RepID=A0A178ZVF7_9EURO|nr:hypothetical protein AYL99_02914 [Fonsecaea erecta]OAP63687.1 hypothetical protein AYL99_02914 [Fonsecaea erecta]
MHYHSHYQDVLGSEGPEYVYRGSDDHGTPPRYWYNPGEFHSINPLLDMSAPYQSAEGFQYSCASYDPVAQGFSYRSMWETGDRALPQLNGFDTDRRDIDHFRHLRHPSPTDPLGFTLSSNSDSSISDHARSPEAARSSLTVPLTHSPVGYWPAPMATSSATGHGWTRQPVFMSSHPSTPVPTNHTVPSMRHLQVTPDPEHYDEPVDMKETFPSRINFPMELELSEQLASPPDSGLDQPGHDDDDNDDEMMKDEEEVAGVTETDNDPEFSPRRNVTRRQFGTTRGHSLDEEPRRLKAVIDPKVRVQKRAQASDTPHSGRSRPKTKKKPRALRNDESGSKHFPCAFHHYGCFATFGNKNEWKRHVSSQHVQLGLYRCDLGTCSAETARTQDKGYNDFNRKDLFTQHCRRMHAPWAASKKGEDDVSKKERDNFEKELEDIRARCWIDRRQAPQKTKCGFCGKKFVDGKESRGWDERMEHVGRHFERDHVKSKDEEVDDGLRQWAIAEGLVKKDKKGEYWLVGFEPAQPSRRAHGQRRSRRFIKEEEEEAEEVGESHSGVDNNEADDDDDDDDADTSDRGPSIKTEDDDEEDDAECDTDAEAEED